MPVARQRPRAPAMLRPWVEVRERYGGMGIAPMEWERGAAAPINRHIRIFP
jgi:hypothetical protein